MIRWIWARRARHVFEQAHELYRKANLANTTGQFSDAIVLRQQADQLLDEAKRLLEKG